MVVEIAPGKEKLKMNNEKYYKDVINQYIEAELGAEEAMEMMVQLQGMNSKAYDYQIYKNSKKQHFVFARNLVTRLVNKTTLGFTSGVFGLNLMFIINRFLDGNVRDVVMASKAIKIMMIEEAILVILTFLLCLAHEVKVLHRMGIKVLSFDLFRLDSTEELEEEEEEEPPVFAPKRKRKSSSGSGWN